MAKSSRMTINTLASVVRTYRRSIAIAGADLALYALVGFVL